MNKYLILSIIALISLSMGIYSYKMNNEQTFSEIALSNIEALANGESTLKPYDALKGEQYVRGPLKRIRNSKGGCEYQNLINPEKDTDCYM